MSGASALAALSRASPESILGKALRLPLRFLSPNAVVRVRSGLNRGRRWVVGSSVHGCWLGHYEIEIQSLMRQIVCPGMRVLDLGANAGFYTLAFAGLVESTGHVWAFEPLAENAVNLRRHLELNSIANVTLIQAAVSSSAGVAGFKVAPSNSMGSLGDRSASYLVPTVSLDDLLESDLIEVPDLVKMDVEGAEAEVLRGAPNLLAHKKTVWVVSLHGRSQQRACTDLLNEAGYEVSPLKRVANEVACDEWEGLLGRPTAIARRTSDFMSHGVIG